MNRFVRARGGRQRVPLTIVGGPEGAGKTSLLRQLLACSDGRRIAIVLDHPSSLALTSAVIAKTLSNSLELHNGSVCLALDGDVGTALLTLHETHHANLPEHVVVEASSSATLLRMSGYSFLPGFRPGGLITVLSAPEIAQLREEGAEPDNGLEAQLQQAELLILNKVDLVKPALRSVVRRWILQRSARARLVESEHCLVPAAMVLGASREHAPVHAIHGEWSPGFSIESEARHNRVVQPRHRDDYRAWLLTTRNTVDARSFRSWVDALPDSILRGDGVLRITGERSHRFQFHRCGLRWSLSRDEPWGDPETDPLSWIALVGLAASAGTGKPRESEEHLAGMEITEPSHFQPPLRPSKSRRSIGEFS